MKEKTMKLLFKKMVKVTNKLLKNNEKSWGGGIAKITLSGCLFSSHVFGIKLSTCFLHQIYNL